MQVILSICIVKSITCNAFGHSLLCKLEHCFPLLFLLKVLIDWYFLAFDEAIACAIPFELTLNYGATLFVCLFVCLFVLACVFYLLVSILLFL